MTLTWQAKLASCLFNARWVSYKNTFWMPEIFSLWKTSCAHRVHHDFVHRAVPEACSYPMLCDHVQLCNFWASETFSLLSSLGFGVFQPCWTCLAGWVWLISCYVPLVTKCHLEVECFFWLASRIPKFITIQPPGHKLAIECFQTSYLQFLECS